MRERTNAELSANSIAQQQAQQQLSENEMVLKVRSVVRGRVDWRLTRASLARA